MSLTTDATDLPARENAGTSPRCEEERDQLLLGLIRNFSPVARFA